MCSVYLDLYINASMNEIDVECMELLFVTLYNQIICDIDCEHMR